MFAWFLFSTRYAKQLSNKAPKPKIPSFVKSTSEGGQAPKKAQNPSSKTAKAGPRSKVGFWALGLTPECPLPGQIVSFAGLKAGNPAVLSRFPAVLTQTKSAQFSPESARSSA